MDTAPADAPRTGDRKKKFLKAPTATYHPQGGNWWGFASAALDGQPVFTWLDVHRMMRDPQVIFISGLWRAPFQKQKFKVTADTKGVAAFVEQTLHRFWRQSLPDLLDRYFQWGFSAGGAEYTAHRGYLRLDRVKAVECRDARPRVWSGGDRKGQFAGFTMRGGTADAFVGSPHAMWFAGRHRYSEYFDIAPLSGLFGPWLEKNGRNGAIHLCRLWFRKHAARGAILYHPPGTTNVGTDESPSVRNNQDVARELLDYAESMGTYTFENAVNPGENGKYEWDLIDVKAQGDVAGFLDYRDRLDLYMLAGAGIPKEVVQSSESGSGYNGRLVPYQGFLGLVDEMSGLVVRACEPWLRPLVGENYGAGAWYEVETISLAEQVEQEQMQAQKRSGEMPAKPGAGGDLPFTLSATVAPPPNRGWELTENGSFIRAAGNPLTLSAYPDFRPAARRPEKPHKFSSVLVVLPPTLAGQLREMAARVPDAALAADGREDEFHVTVRYGLHDDSPDDAREIVAHSPPVRVSLGGVSVFRGADCGKDYDVLKVDVSSPDLRRLNRELAALPHTDTHRDYRPHATIAYVKAGLGDALAALAQPVNADFTAREVVFSGATGAHTTLPLAKPVEMAATVTPEDDPAAKAAAFDATAKKLTRQRKSTVVQLLALAMVRAQQRATAAGKPEAAAGSLSALAEMAGDPVEVAKVVGMKELSALELAWTAYTGPRGGVGAVSDTLKDAAGRPRKLYGEAARRALEAQGNRTTREEGAKKAKEIIGRLAARKSSLEELPTLAENLKHLTLKELNHARAALEAGMGIGFNMRGEARKEWRIQRIMDRVEQRRHAEEDLPAPKLRAPEHSRNPKPGKYAGTVAAAVSRMGGIDPHDHEFLTHYGSVKEAVDDGIPRAAFVNRAGGRGRGGLDQLARELHAAGHVTVPDGVRPSEYVLDLLKKNAKVHGEEGASDKVKAEERRQRELFGDDAGEHAPDPEVEAELRGDKPAPAVEVNDKGYPASWDEPIPEPEAKAKAEPKAKAGKKPKGEPKPPPAPVAAEIEKQVEKPAPKKKPRNTPSVVPEDESRKIKAAVAYNALLEAAQRGAGEDVVNKLRERAKAAATEFAPEKDRATLLTHVERAAKGLGKPVALPKEDESQYEGVQPDDDAPPPVAPPPDDEGDDDAPESQPEEKTALEVKAEKARDAWREAVARKAPAKKVAELKKRLDEYAAALPEDRRDAILGAAARKATAGILAEPETQAFLARLRAAKPAPVNQPSTSGPPPAAEVATRPPDGGGKPKGKLKKDRAAVDPNANSPARNLPKPPPGVNKTAAPHTGPAAVWRDFAGATGSARTYLGDALNNAGATDPESRTGPPADLSPDRLLSGLAGAYLAAMKAGDPAAAAQLAASLRHVGGEVRGKPGDAVTFDGTHHEGPPGMFTGHPAKVVVPPVVRASDGANLRHGKVVPA